MNKRIKILRLSIFCILCGIFSEAYAKDIHHNIGLGIGVPFGGLFGISYELEIDVNDTFSIGPTLSQSVGWDLGVQFHFLDKNELLRLGLSAWYGSNGYLSREEDEDSDEYDTFKGVTLGGNVRFQLGRLRKHAIDFHILYVVSSEFEGDEGYIRDSDSDVVIALGYKYRF